MDIERSEQLAEKLRDSLRSYLREMKPDKFFECLFHVMRELDIIFADDIYYLSESIKD